MDLWNLPIPTGIYFSSLSIQIIRRLQITVYNVEDIKRLNVKCNNLLHRQQRSSTPALNPQLQF